MLRSIQLREMMDDSSCSKYTHETLSSWCHNLQELPLIPTNSCCWSQQFSASRSHSEAEKRRRDRINAQLSTLRKLIPTSEQVNLLKLKQKRLLAAINILITKEC